MRYKLIALFLLLASGVLAQPRGIYYEPFALGGSGVGAPKTIVPRNAAQRDSIWNALLVDSVIAGNQIWYAQQYLVSVGPSPHSARLLPSFQGSSVTLSAYRSNILPVLRGGTGRATLDTVPVSRGGTGATTAEAALVALLPDTAGESDKLLGVVTGGGIAWHSPSVPGLILESDDNTGVGVGALSGNAGSRNVAFGADAINGNSGNQNVAIGYHSMQGNTFGYDNVGVGYAALLGNAEGVRNVAVGYDALRDNNTSGSYIVAIGAGAGVSTDSLTNAIAIGSAASVGASNTAQIGSGLESLRTDGAFQPGVKSDADAISNSLFIGSDHTNKLCWKDGSAAVHVLY